MYWNEFGPGWDLNATSRDAKNQVLFSFFFNRISTNTCCIFFLTNLYFSLNFYISHRNVSLTHGRGLFLSCYYYYWKWFPTSKTDAVTLQHPLQCVVRTWFPFWWCLHSLEGKQDYSSMCIDVWNGAEMGKKNKLKQRQIFIAADPEKTCKRDRNVGKWSTKVRRWREHFCFVLFTILAAGSVFFPPSTTDQQRDVFVSTQFWKFSTKTAPAPPKENPRPPLVWISWSQDQFPSKYLSSRLFSSPSLLLNYSGCTSCFYLYTLNLSFHCINLYIDINVVTLTGWIKNSSNWWPFLKKQTKKNIHIYIYICHVAQINFPAQCKLLYA